MLDFSLEQQQGNYVIKTGGPPSTPTAPQSTVCGTCWRMSAAANGITATGFAAVTIRGGWVHLPAAAIKQE